MGSECENVHQKTNEKQGDVIYTSEEFQEIELLTARLTSLETEIAEMTLIFAEKTTEKENTNPTITTMNTNRAAENETERQIPAKYQFHPDVFIRTLEELREWQAACP